MSQIISFELTEKEQQLNAISTIVSMLIARKIIDETERVTTFNKIIKNADVDTNILIDETYFQYNNIKYVIKFYNYTLTSIKNKDIETYVGDNINNHKILIVNNITSRAIQQLATIKDLEYFTLLEIVRDISKHMLIPKHILLSNDEAKQLMEEYNIKQKDMGMICYDDPMARFLNAKIGNIIQIIRYSIYSGYSTYYRLVANKSIHI